MNAARDLGGFSVLSSVIADPVPVSARVILSLDEVNHNCCSQASKWSRESHITEIEFGQGNVVYDTENAG